MHAPNHSDLIALARLIRARPTEMRRWVLARVLCEATAAAEWMGAHGSCHPVWGDGTLMAAALRRGPLPQFGLDDRDYCTCLASAVRALAAHGAATK